MFHVLPETAQYLYSAQFPHHRGRLRLDISSRRFPTDPRRRFDLACAVEAIGERVVGLLVGCALDARLLNEVRSASDPAQSSPIGNHQSTTQAPSLPDSNNRIRIVSNHRDFEGFVVKRLDRDFGLDEFSKAHSKALTSLARDFHEWVVREPQSSKHWFSHSNGEVFVQCKSSVEKNQLTDLKPAEAFEMDEHEEGTELSSQCREYATLELDR